jgi:hypothetical protein
MIGSLVWKEYREHRAVWLVMAVVSSIALLGVVRLLVPGGAPEVSRHADLLVLAGACLSWGYGMVCGAMLLAGETEEGTLSFLDMLPRWRRDLWQTKFSVGVGLVVANVLVVGSVLAGLGVATGAGPFVAAVGVLLVAGVVGLGWGLLFSARGNNALQAVALAAGTQILSGFILLTSLTLFDLVLGVDLETGIPVTSIVLLLGMLLVTVLTFVGSRRIFSTTDRLRMRSPSIPGRVAGIAGVGELFWLAWRQCRVFTAGLGLACLALGWLVLVTGAWLWPLLTLLIGVVAGATTFADEQASEAYRFLGEQRFPRGRTWLVKTMVRFAAGFLALSCLLLPATLRAMVALAQHSNENIGPGGVLARLFDDELIGALATPVPFLLMWFLHGFGIGHVCGMLFRKALVAVMVALGVGVVCVSVWLPSVVNGGLLGWQVLGVPLAALVAGRLVFSGWTAGTVWSLRTGHILAGSMLFGIASIAAGLAYRIAEVPEPPLQLDLPAFREQLATAERTFAGVRIRQALGGLRVRLQSLPVVPPPSTPQPGARSNPADEAFLSQIAGVLTEGWPRDRPHLERWLEHVFDAPWAGQLEQGVRMPLGLLDDPRRLTLASPLAIMQNAEEASDLLLARGLARQASGDPAAFLDDLQTTLAFCRHLRHHAVRAAILITRRMEQRALAAVDCWLERLEGHPELLRQLVAELRRHVEWLPEDSGQGLASEYLLARNSLDHPEELISSFERTRGGSGRALSPALVLAWQVPWERERNLRLVGWSFLDSPAQGVARWPLGAHLGLASHAHQREAFNSSRRWRDALLQMRVVGAALRWYQCENVRPPANLDALLAGYLPDVPRDPYDGQAIRYRISPGEEIGLDSGKRRRISTGQAILWCVGEDCIDDGGRNQHGTSSANAVPADVVYLVPMPL